MRKATTKEASELNLADLNLTAELRTLLAAIIANRAVLDALEPCAGEWFYVPFSELGGVGTNKYKLRSLIADASPRLWTLRHELVGGYSASGVFLRRD